MKTALLAVLVGQLASPDGGVELDAGTGWNAPLYAECPVAPPAERTDGGWLYPDARKRRVDCLMETCRKHDELTTARLLTEPTSLLPGWFVPSLSGFIGLGLGIVLGYVIARSTTGSR